MLCTRSMAVVFISLLAVIPSQAQSQSKDSADIEAVKQIELDLGTLAIAGHFDKLSQLYADDYVVVGSSGKAYTKKDVLDGEESNRLL